MAENKKAFVVYTDWKKYIDDLEDVQIGEWTRWIFEYCNDKWKDKDSQIEYPTDAAVKMLCLLTKDILKRDLKKYEEKKNRLLKNGKQYRTDIDTKSKRNQNEIDTDIGTDIETNIGTDIETNIGTDIETNIETVNSNKLLVNNNIDSNNINYSGKELNSNNINNNILSFPESEKDRLYKQIFDYWNSKKIVVHKNMTQELIKVLDETLKLYSKEEVGHAIKHYAEMYHDKNYFFKYKWTLIEFLTRSNGLPEFLENGNKWVNYLNRYNNTKQQSYNSVEELPEYMQQMLKEES